MFLEKGSFEKDPSKSELWNRGAYLSNALAHCGECHTPRNLLGGLKASMHYAGSREGPEGELAPNITPDQETGIGAWSKQDLQWLLETGMKPDADNVQGLMAEAIDDGYSHLPRKTSRPWQNTLHPFPRSKTGSSLKIRIPNRIGNPRQFGCIPSVF